MCYRVATYRGQQLLVEKKFEKLHEVFSHLGMASMEGNIDRCVLYQGEDLIFHLHLDEKGKLCVEEQVPRRACPE